MNARNNTQSLQCKEHQQTRDTWDVNVLSSSFQGFAKAVSPSATQFRNEKAGFATFLDARRPPAMLP